ncbi:zinc finger, C2H2 type [Dictyocaulus viviparus]|uniref:Zinc finger, C2H2 type n=1 Tax=Dictyocaulus viviparus TaxID=29172 RepID=A0A0D8XLR4_DICVI|nr:zinc finger, C2H2 type [Dictyocaulus viviparus]
MCLNSTSSENVAVRTVPRYAIMKLQPETDCVALFQYALSQGICDLSFVSSPYEFFADLHESTPTPTRNICHDLSITSPSLLTSPTSHTHINQQPFINGVQNVISNDVSTTPLLADGQTASPHCVSGGSNSPPSSIDHFNTVLSTLFGKGEPAKDIRIINGPPPLPTSPPPEIPGPGQIKCRLCGITVSCKKIANLTAHALKIHTPVPLWRCPKSDCEFDHADFTRVRSHIRTSHPELHGEIPRDNRNSATVSEAQRYLAHCYPSIDWTCQYANIFPTVKAERRDQTAVEFRDPASEWYTVIDEKNMNMPVQCSACKLMVALNRHSIEDHVKTMHTGGRQFQCGVCKYTSVEEWKVRVHASIRHPETQCLQMLTVTSYSKPYLYIRELFPDIAALLPEDEVDEMLYGFRQLNPSVLLSVPTSHSSLPDSSTDKTAVDPTSSTDLNQAKVPVIFVNSKLFSMFLQFVMSTIPQAEEARLLPDSFQTIFLELLNNQQTSISTKQSPIRKNQTFQSVERFGSRVECAMCKAAVESKRTMLVGHAKSHCPQRQWQCPHCETTAAFHSKLKLHVQNAHKSDAEPMDMYSAELENKWLELFRQCFPQFAQQCFVEEWKFRSKQQQHLHSASAEELNTRGSEGGEQLRRTILIESDEPQKDRDSNSGDITTQSEA